MALWSGLDGVDSTGWNIKSLMKGAFQLLKDSPARREDFITVTGSPKLPLYNFFQQGKTSYLDVTCINQQLTIFFGFNK